MLGILITIFPGGIQLQLRVWHIFSKEQLRFRRGFFVEVQGMDRQARVAIGPS